MANSLASPIQIQKQTSQAGRMKQQVASGDKSTIEEMDQESLGVDRQLNVSTSPTMVLAPGEIVP